MYRAVIKMTNNSVEREYKLYPIYSIDQRNTKPVTSISLSGQSYKNNILMGLAGMESDFSISFSIWNNGTDRSGHGGNIVTVEEQIEYLQDTIHDHTSVAKWELTLYDGTITVGNEWRYTSLDVFLENIDIPIISMDGWGQWIKARMDLIVGEGI